MKRITATAIGLVLAAGLAYATPTGKAEDLVDRYHTATTEAGISANWRDWHPDASHQVHVLTGLAGQDFSFSYAISEWETLPDWQNNPEVVEAMEGYSEVGRSERQQTLETQEGMAVITTTVKIQYDWDGYKGTMTETDRFEITTLAGRSVIRRLTSTYDYR